MGFFTSKSEQTSVHNNAILGQYTSYRAFSPWSFAALDPAAFLAASSAREKDAGTFDAWATRNQIDTQAMKDPEFRKQMQAQYDREQRDAQFADQALTQLQSGKLVTPEIESQVNDIYKYEEARLMESFKQGASELAGSRGLRPSDTPISRPMFQQLGIAQLGIASQRAGMKLNLGTQQQAFLEGMREFQKNLEFNRFSARLNAMYGGGLQGASQIHYTDQTKGSYTPSGFQQMAAVTGYAMGVGSFGMGAATGGQAGASMMASGQSGMSSLARG